MILFSVLSTVSSQNTEENERTQHYFLILNLNAENEGFGEEAIPWYTVPHLQFPNIVN